MTLGEEQISQQDLRGILSVLGQDSVAADAAQDASADERAQVQPLDALNFHISLSQWIDDERVQQQVQVDVDPVWDYDFWKADLIERSPLDQAQRKALHIDRDPADEALDAGEYFAYTVEVFFGEEPQGRRYQYWVALDDAGRPLRSDWIDRAPDADKKAATFSDWSGGKRGSGLIDVDLLREIYLKSVNEQDGE